MCSNITHEALNLALVAAIMLSRSVFDAIKMTVEADMY